MLISDYLCQTIVLEELMLILLLLLLLLLLPETFLDLYRCFTGSLLQIYSRSDQIPRESRGLLGNFFYRLDTLEGVLGRHPAKSLQQETAERSFI